MFKPDSERVLTSFASLLAAHGAHQTSLLADGKYPLLLVPSDTGINSMWLNRVLSESLIFLNDPIC